jgi:hypothetical protein
MRSKIFKIFINEETEFNDAAKEYSVNLDNNIKTKKDRLKTTQEAIKNRQEQDKELELQTKESQKYNLEQITQKKAGYNVTKSPEEQKRIRLELVRLEKEKKRIADTLIDIAKDRQEFLRLKNEEIKDLEDEIRETEKMKSELQKTIKASEDAAKSQQAKVPAPQAKITAEGDEDYLDKYGFIIKRKFARMEEQEEPTIGKKKSLIVNFDKSTKAPFQVKFTERGFLIGKTRLSFEFLEAALSKELNIVLENGAGLVLDAIKMQKILKYKDRI